MIRSSVASSASLRTLFFLVIRRNVVEVSGQFSFDPKLALDSEFTMEEMICRSSFQAPFSFESDRGRDVYKNISKERNTNYKYNIMLFLFQMHVLPRDFLSTSTSTQTRFYVLSATCKKLDQLGKGVGNIAKERLNKMLLWDRWG